MNVIFAVFVFASFICAAWKEILFSPSPGIPSPMELLSKAMIDSATGAVSLSLGLVGVMTLFLGLVKIAEAGGMLTILARLMRPLMVRLFPDVPPDHPAMGAMILNLSANVLGLGNAATPFGIRAMQALDTLNDRPGVATNAMALFLSINTACVTLLPTGVIALRAAAGSRDPAGILPTTLIAGLGSTVVAVIAAKLLQRVFPLGKGPEAEERLPGETGGADIPIGPAEAGYPAWVGFAALGALAALLPLTVVYGKIISPWILPGIMIGFLAFGIARKVRIYEVFVEGAKEGFQVAIKIIPYLVAILSAVGMLRASGALETIVSLLGAFTEKVGLPAQALPMALLRPLSGSGAYGILASLIQDPSIGPDSYTGYLISTLQGSSETTFYVIAVYFGAVQIKRLRHTLASALISDLSAVVFSILICTYLYG